VRVSPQLPPGNSYTIIEFAINNPGNDFKINLEKRLHNHLSRFQCAPFF